MVENKNIINFILLLIPIIPVFVLLGVWIDKVILKRQKSILYNKAVNYWWSINNYQIKNLPIQACTSIYKVIKKNPKTNYILYIIKIALTSCILTFIFYYLGTLISIDKHIYTKDAFSIKYSPDWKVVILNILTDFIIIITTIKIINNIVKKNRINIFHILMCFILNWLFMQLIIGSIIISNAYLFNKLPYDSKLEALKSLACDSTTFYASVNFPVTVDSTDMSVTLEKATIGTTIPQENLVNKRIMTFKLNGMIWAKLNINYSDIIRAFSESNRIILDIIKNDAGNYEIETQVECDYLIPDGYRITQHEELDRPSIFFNTQFPVVLTYNSLLLASTSFIPSVLILFFIIILFICKFILFLYKYTMMHVLEIATEDISIKQIQNFKPFTLFGILLGIILMLVIILLLVIYYFKII
ncbi:MAG: hypothetical protein IT271_05555 [Chitinophagales bacterium]|nr:hypothetical protein [Chitinophagales bacterium]